MKKIDLSLYKIKQVQNDSKITSWQEYALNICKDFGITGAYKAMIFRYAKNNISYLKGKVENTKEKFGEKGLLNKGNYLISLFRKNPPWIK